MRHFIAGLTTKRDTLWIIDGEWRLFEGPEDRTGKEVSDQLAGTLMRVAITDRDRTTQHHADLDDLWRQHMALVHPDGEDCPDGCGGY